MAQRVDVIPLFWAILAKLGDFFGHASWAVVALVELQNPRVGGLNLPYDICRTSFARMSLIRTSFVQMSFA